MSGSDYTPLASLSSRVAKETPVEDGVHEIIDDIEALVRAIGDEASRDYHRLIRKLFKLRTHPSITRSDC